MPPFKMVESIGQIAITTQDLTKSLDFYHRVLELELLFEVAPNMAFLKCGETRLMITTEQGEASDHHTSVIYYKVANLEETVAKLKHKGIAFIREVQLTAKMSDHELWQGFIRDPDGHLVGIMAEKPLQA